MVSSLPKRVGIAVFVAGFLALTFGTACTSYLHLQEVDNVSDAQKLARTLRIIHTSSPSDRKILKVLFYGQSITRVGWDKLVVDHWHQKYPSTVFEVKNLALGGFPSQELVRTTERDIAAFYPDLIIFHDYGDHRAYERIIRLFRSRTAADIIVQTDHGEVLPDPPCSEGLHLPPDSPGCTGTLWVHQRNWHDEMSYHRIPSLAKKYGVAVEPQRIWWRDYLLNNHLEAHSLLVDDIHPNEKGKQLIATFFNRYFDNLVAQWHGQAEHNVISLPAGAVQQAGSNLDVDFDGNRLEMLTNKPLDTPLAITIDGVPARDVVGCYQVSRVSALDTVPDWPALRRISLTQARVPEDWTATLTRISPDQKSFQFTVSSSATRDEGTGDSAHDFVSKNGALRIEAQDWMVDRAFQERHIPLQAPTEVHWSVKESCGGEPEVIARGDGTAQYRYVLGAGLSNGKHIVAVAAQPNVLPSVTEFRAYKPPLMDSASN